MVYNKPIVHFLADYRPMLCKRPTCSSLDVFEHLSTSNKSTFLFNSPVLMFFNDLMEKSTWEQTHLISDGFYNRYSAEISLYESFTIGIILIVLVNLYLDALRNNYPYI